MRKETEIVESTPMSSNKNYKPGDLVTAWLNPPGAGRFDNTKIIALIVHDREGKSVVDVLCCNGAIRMWREDLRRVKVEDLHQ